MKIVVCVKQVPDTADIKWTENNTMIRDGVESILNPFDEYAVETAIRIKEAHPDSTITVLTMGPPQAKDALKRCIAMGADEAILVTDKKFAGADTQATSRTVAKAIKEKGGNFDLIICGQFAIDGDTAQTGPSIAEHLCLPQVTYVKEVEHSGGNTIVAKREVEEGIQKVEMQLPGLVCMVKCDYEPRMPSIKGVMKANKTQISEVSMEGLGLDPSEVGIKGSPTFVSRAFRPETRNAGEILNAANAKEAADVLIEKLKNDKVLV
ncbi:MAG: electron transfer flavoprotein subunit beta [Candidatus Melainabacteria bacterium RIFOXYA12_FULL_32_12]|nr:MAG: electron transfer flavoprotein subunit beta [Candidatus Melainabacteria bacterium RIFOXYA2_FULL_32_9]OGI26498.1 MAG: electron transfer flavoprotein subunit beta [Candidatus Melainabacteria bacterium RIFOXYA12_FULL_32_12]